MADTPAWWRLAALPPDVASSVRLAIAADRLCITPIVRMEILHSARSTAEFAALERELDGLRTLRNDRAVTDAAMHALADLAEVGAGYHRVSVTDALIAAAAAEHGGLAVLHRDAHFERLGEVLAFASVRLPGL